MWTTGLIIVCVILISVIYYYYKEDENKKLKEYHKNRIIKEKEESIQNQIANKAITLKMDREVVRKILGDEYNIKSYTNEKGTYTTAYYIKTDNGHSKYVMYLNDKVVEFGDN